MSGDGSGSAGRRPPLRRTLEAVLGAVGEVPVVVLTERLDIVGANLLGKALLSPVFDAGRANLARFVFLDEDRSSEFYPDWAEVADANVGQLRRAAARDPHDRSLHRLIGEMSTSSVPFGRRWSQSRCLCVRPAIRIHHPLVGDLHLACEELTPRADPSQTVSVYTPAPDTDTHERLGILASWAQVPDEPITKSDRPLGKQRGEGK